MPNLRSWLRRTALVAALCTAWMLPWAEDFGASGAPQPSSQSPTQDWQAAAGGKMAFDSISIDQNTSTAPAPVFSNFPLGPGDVYIPNGGIFSARNFPLAKYIFFAYKINSNQEQFVLSELPQWVITNRFNIRARADGNPTKDQMRLMMQTLLADRFRLAAHYETREVPLLALVVDQPGQLGPLLQKHPEDSPCPTTPYVPSPPPTAPPQALAVDTRFPVACGGILGMPPSTPGRVRVGARNVPMDLIASSMTGGDTGLRLPVINKTALIGRFDFAIEFVPEGTTSKNSQPDSPGSTFLEALKKQLGLKLESQKGQMDLLVIDYIEQPSPN